MGFGEVFGKSWKEYKVNFRSIFIFMSIFILIPGLLVILFNIFSIGNNANLQKILFNPSLVNMGKSEAYFFIFSLLMSLVAMFLLLLTEAGLINVSLGKNKYSFKELRDGGLNSLGKFIIFSLVLMIFLGGLFLLLIIPGIIFVIYWIFAVYVFFGEKKGILYSLRRSMEIVKGRWWRVFGYSILMILIMVGINIAASLITLPTTIIYLINITMGKEISSGLFILNSILEVIASFVGNLISIPLFVLFFKNLYLDMKKSKN
ncbi:MAG: hypothetical protein AABW75_05160 [Nanoarchaeota archaeon]